MITAMILAAGKSTRMGSPKMLLPWGKVTVLEHVIAVFAQAGVEDVLVVTGGAHEQVEALISTCQKQYPVRSMYNKNYASGEMLTSIQCGLQQLAKEAVSAALIGLGDQPQVQESSVRLIRDAFQQSPKNILVPSFHMRRGHPWLVARPLWSELLGMQPTQTPRDFLNAHASDIQYVDVATPSIFADLDTPEEYRAARP